MGGALPATAQARPPAEPRKWSAHGPLFVGSLAVCLLFGVLGIWGNFATISGAVIASGMIQVESLRQIVQHPQGGVVGQINVKEGDTVTAGDVLIRFDDTLVLAELGALEKQMAEVSASKSRLQAERDENDKIVFEDALLTAAETDPDTAGLIESQQRLFEARLETQTKRIEQLTERKEQIRLQIKGTQAQLISANEQVELISKELVNQQDLLNKGLAQASRVLALQREAAQLNGTIGQLESSAARGRAQILETDIQILSLQTQRREEAISALRDISYREIEMRERLSVLEETIARMDVRAPMSGVVYGLNIHTLRSVVRPADPILYVVPNDSPFVVTSRIDAIHIDQVNLGQVASMLFSAFDQRTTPEISGIIRKISADVFVDEMTGISYYSAEIIPLEGELKRLGDVELLPGMPVEVFIKTEDRTPISYLTKPLTDYFKRALRES
ncbi:MAG: HlyD family type I secretion periplasmic adaptor subunit [Rhodobacteraceae bacterium]|nr:HlyD family type I secretion periplasmic adaptor subunit [Paracoccaceae bacterium]